MTTSLPPLAPSLALSDWYPSSSAFIPPDVLEDLEQKHVSSLEMFRSLSAPNPLVGINAASGKPVAESAEEDDEDDDDDDQAQRFSDIQAPEEDDDGEVDAATYI